MDLESEARKAWVVPRRGDYRIEVEIHGSRVWVGCKGDSVRVVIQRPEGGSQVETDLVGRVEVHSWGRGQILETVPENEAAELIPLTGARRSASG